MPVLRRGLLVGERLLGQLLMSILGIVLLVLVGIFIVVRITLWAVDAATRQVIRGSW